jgi:hypothetical protein
MPIEAAADDRQHQGIADQFSAGHDGLSFFAELTASGHLCPQQIAGGQMQQAMALSELLSLGAFAGARGAKEQEALLHGKERKREERG